MGTYTPRDPRTSEHATQGGREVSCKALELYLTIAQSHGKSPEEFLEGLGLTVTQARDPSHRIAWSTYARICERTGALVGSPEALADEGARYLEGPSLQAVTTIAVLVTSARSLYWVGHKWAGASLFGIQETGFEVVGPCSVLLTVHIPEPYEVPLAHFHLTAGTFRAAPRMLGLPDSVVETKIDGRTCRYLIHHAPSATLWSRARHALLAVFSARRAFEEMRAQNDTLQAQVRELVEARRLANEALSLKSRFLTTVTHEMRTPLAAILGMSDLLEESLGTPEAPQHLATLRDQALGLLTIVNDVLDLQTLNQGRLSVTQGSFDPAALGRELVELFRERAARAGLGLSFTPSPTLPARVSGDGAIVSQALRRLVDNALKFTPSGEVELKATMEGEARLCFAVRDTGVGVEPAWRERIFEPFRQRQDARLSRTVGGVGLGLTVARQLAEGLGGELRLESRVGAGSTFTLVVAARPLAPPAEAPVQAPILRSRTLAPPPPPATPPLPETPPLTEAELRRVLVVEDNPVNQKILVRMLEKLGHGSAVAENGQLAVQAHARSPFAAILMDLQMPVMDGFEATLEIRKREGRERHTPIIAVTANHEDDFRRRADEVGMDAFLAKPVQRGGLAEVLDRYLPASA